MKALQDRQIIQAYLQQIYGEEVKLLGLSTSPPGAKDTGPKGFGYGQPIFLEYSVRGKRESAVLETVKDDDFGHQYLADRAHNVILAHSTFGNLPKHAESIDAGIVTKSQQLRSVGDAEEYFQLTKLVQGHEYFRDLERIKQTGRLEPLDTARAEALADYLAGIHSETHPQPALYARRIRELVGHAECIMGLIDSYPPDTEIASPEELQKIEQNCVAWRWRLKSNVTRLRRVHGDFHPWNILFGEGTDFSLIDRSRGEWGEAADDVSALTINYLFYSLRTYGDFRPPFRKLWDVFHSRYLDKTGDSELYSVIQPFYAWRGLVIASPIWYPDLTRNTRQTLFNFINRVLDSDKFDYEEVNELLKPL